MVAWFKMSVEKPGRIRLRKSSSFRSEAKIRRTEPNGTLGFEKMSRSDFGVTEEKLNCPVSKLSPNLALPLSASVTKCNDLMRDKVWELLFEALSRVSGEASNSITEQVNACDPSRIVVSVESTMFQNWGRMNGNHKVKYTGFEEKSSPQPCQAVEAPKDDHRRNG
ncbi:hypothetical protein NL676_019129 [Syzygium grande]|nr:hypothetical protein NL676_019129 [Syzygium grande]